MQLANIFNDYVNENLAGGVYNLNYRNDFLNKDIIAKNRSSDIYSFSSIKYMDKNYLVSGDASEINIYRTQNSEFENWELVKTFEAFGSQTVLLSASNGLNIFYPNLTSDREFEFGGIKNSTTIDGQNWTSGVSLYKYDTYPALFLTGSSTGSNFGYSFDLVYEQEQEKIIMAVGSYTADPVSYNEGEVYIITGSLIQDEWRWSDKQLVYSGGIASSSAGAALSLISCSAGYQLFISSPFQIVSTTTESTGSIQYLGSTDGINWSTPGYISRGSLRYENSLIGTDIKAVDYNNKTFVFFSEPWVFTTELRAGGVFVITSSINNSWSIDTDYDKKLIYSSHEFQNFSPSPIYSMDSIALLSSSNALYYGINDMQYQYNDLNTGKVAIGKTDGNDYWETMEEKNLLLISDEKQSRSAISVLSETIDGKEYPIYFVDKKDPDDSFNHTYLIKNNIFTEYRLRTTDTKKYYKNAAFEPFFAPGILYNTIKSGIAVDWPCTTGSDISVVPYSNSGNNIVFNNFYVKEYEMETHEHNGVKSSVLGNLRSKIDYRIPFENLIFPFEAFVPKEELSSDLVSRTTSTALPEDDALSQFINGTYLYGGYEPYISPHDFGEIENLGPKRFSTPFVYKKREIKNSGLYSLAMSNFLAETVKFFLKNEKMSTFVSEPDYKWGQFDSSKTYYMDIVLEKTPDFAMIESYSSDVHPTGSRGQKMSGRYFGYPVNKTSKDIWAGSDFTEEEKRLIHNDPAYAPYTPPYFEGLARARISFKPSGPSRNYTLQEIFDEAKVENIFEDISNSVDPDSDALRHKMPISSSIDIFGSSQAVEVTIDEATGQQTIRELQDSQNWVISPRMETPVLNFIEQELVPYENNYSKTGGFGRGIWSGYGSIPSGSAGIKMRLEYPYGSISSLYTASLLQQTGLRSEERKIGTIADRKKIEEAIVIIPFLEAQDESYTLENDTGFNFFKIDTEVFNLQKQNIEQKKPAVDEEIVSTSISKMIEKMKKYVIPPQMNFIDYDTIEPFIMYIFEFDEILDKQDLSDIWQGLMPKISIDAKLQDVEISHPSGPNEFFGGKPLPENIRWMIFKVKRRAEYNYFNVTSTTKDDKRFDFNKIIGRESGTDIYSYNWPYDFFSLVELAKVELAIDYKKKEEDSN